MFLRLFTAIAAALLFVSAAALAEKDAADKIRARNGGYLGIFVREKTPGVVTIDRVHPGGGAEKAGLKAGDVIQAVNGRSLANGDQLIRRMWGARPYTLTVKRGEETLDIKTSTAELDSVPQVGDGAPPFSLPLRDGSGKVSLDDLLAKGRPVVLVFGSFT